MSRLTATGWGVAASGPPLLAAGILARYAFLAGVGLAALAAVAAAIVVTLVRYRIAAQRTVTPDRVTVGGTVRMSIVVRNLTALPTPSFSASVHIGESGEMETLDLPVPSMGPRGRVEVSTVVQCSRRGLIRLGPAAVRRRDPLGLARRDAGFSSPDWLWVHPRVHHIAPLPAGLVLDFEGRAALRSHAGSATFAALREYNRGDDPRHIHWRTTARTGTLVVKHHVDTTEPATTIALDTRSEVLDALAFEEAVEVAASITAASARAGRDFTLCTAGAVLEAGAHDFLDHLAALTQSPGSLADLAGTIDRAPPGGSLAIISAGTTPGLLEALAPQRRRFAMVVAILIGDEGGVLNRRPGLTVVGVHSAAQLAAAWPSVLRGAA
ncbi:MAG TPA: DUF58 domain-containing protein [Candidatus Limnocylindrales bacterium]|nr:DUF58 domain-containing protein [Candidatus Limnocylindrales bacterium]